MPAAGGGFEQCYNAQAAVTAGSLLVVAADVVQAPNDKQQLAPVRQQRIRLAKFVGQRSEFVQHGIAESRAEAIVIPEGLPQTILLIEYSLNLKRTVNQEQYQRHRRIVLWEGAQQCDLLDQIQRVAHDRVRSCPHQYVRLRNDAEGTAEMDDDTDHMPRRRAGGSLPRSANARGWRMRSRRCCAHPC